MALLKVTAAFANEMQAPWPRGEPVYSDVQTGDFYYPLDAGIEAYDLCHYEGESHSIPLWYKANGRFCVPLISVKLVV